MEIERKELLENLEQFVKDGNGIIIGSPGIGKSYSLLKLKGLLANQNIPHVILSIDQLGTGKIDELRELLSFEGDLVEKFKLEISQLQITPGIILVDAFDAARSDEIRQRFLSLIRRFVYELKGLWNVIVTVRTYDALKSQTLLDLFGDAPENIDTCYLDPKIPCRHFVIPPLNENELKQAIHQIPRLDKVHGIASSDLKELLKIPFNLWLIEQILKDSNGVPEISHVNSEVQLLNLFWKRRVSDRTDSDDRELVLTRLVRRMVDKKSLSLRKENVYKIEEKETWTNLYSDEILIQVSTSYQRVSFSHNILFDYAVSILLIEDDPNELMQFILENPSRPVFLRPSLDYYFTRLWHDEPSIFWNVYRDILSNANQNLRLFTRLLPPLVIAREARNINEFDPLLELFKKANRIANEAMLRILQAHKALQVSKDLLWIRFFERVSKFLHHEFAWDMTILSSSILDKAQNTDNKKIGQLCGKVGRSILSWVWEKRKESNNKEWFDRLGALRAAPLVAKTFWTDVSESRELLNPILNLVNEERFPIIFFFHLAENIESIMPHDSGFVSSFYTTVFGYEETSEERKNFGSPILPLSTTRKQDFQMCQFRLKKHFPAFLNKKPLLATKTAIHFITQYIKNNHIVGYLKSGVELEDMLQRFRFRGKDAYYLPDASYIWDQRSYREKYVLEIADEVFSYLSKIAKLKEKKDFLESMLDVFRDNVLTAFFWKRLLKAGIELPMVFAPLLFELCIASPIQTGHETTYESGLFVKKAAKEFSEEQLKQIEESILVLPEGESNEDQLENLENIRDRLLACIPEPMLKTDVAREIIKNLKKVDKVPENEPLFNVTASSREVTDKMWLEKRGVKTEKKENLQLIEFFDLLDNFNSQWANDSQREESVKKELLKKVQEAYKHVQAASGADKEVIDMLWTKLASAAEAISRSPINSGGEESRFCREIFLKSSEHELPVYNLDSDKDSEFIIWSPAPRIEAAKGLPQLAAQDADEEVLSAIKKLAFDKVTAIRFVLASRLWHLHQKNTDFFWELIQSFANKEKNNNVLGALSTTLYNIVNRDESKTVEVLKIITENFLSNQKATGQFSEILIRLIVRLAFRMKNPWSAETINTILENQEDYLFIFNSFSFEIFKYLDALEVRYSGNTLDMVIESLGKMINSVVKAIQKYRSVPENKLEENQRIRMKSLYEVFDDIVLRLYFSTDIEENEHYKEKKLSDNELERFYFKIKPLLESLLFFPEDKEKVLMGPHTAYHFTRLLNNVLKFDPKGALHMAAEVALSSKPFGYNLDSTAVKEVVKTVETILADHRNEVREDSVLEDLLNLLDVFAETGWPEAIQLTWRLDEIFR